MAQTSISAKHKLIESDIKTANALTMSQIKSQYLQELDVPHTAKDGHRYSVTLHTASSMSAPEFKWCFELIEETSSADYKALAEGGWNPKEKKEEMVEEDMRYLLLRRTEPEATICKEKDIGNVDEILAFTSMMLTMEEDEAVVYLYEVHLNQTVRGLGLGKYLIDLVESFGQNVGVTKCMLTVFTRNEYAEQLYRRLGYSEDEISPRPRRLRGGKVKKPAYFILSKELVKPVVGS